MAKMMAAASARPAAISSQCAPSQCAPPASAAPAAAHSPIRSLRRLRGFPGGTGCGLGSGAEGAGAGAGEAVVAAVDPARDRVDVVAIGGGVEVALAPLGERRLERVRGRADELRVCLEVDAALLAHPAIVG